jgi:hypothetical protein
MRVRRRRQPGCTACVPSASAEYRSDPIARGASPTHPFQAAAEQRAQQLERDTSALAEERDRMAEERDRMAAERQAAEDQLSGARVSGARARRTSTTRTITEACA